MLMSGLMPMPPATNTALRRVDRSMPRGGQTKLPPTRTLSSEFRISGSGRQSHAAGLSGDFFMASSR